jgi:hypothetical protein
MADKSETEHHDPVASDSEKHAGSPPPEGEIVEDPDAGASEEERKIIVRTYSTYNQI